MFVKLCPLAPYMPRLTVTPVARVAPTMPTTPSTAFLPANVFLAYVPIYIKKLTQVLLINLLYIVPVHVEVTQVLLTNLFYIVHALTAPVLGPPALNSPFSAVIHAPHSSLRKYRMVYLTPQNINYVMKRSHF